MRGRPINLSSIPESLIPRLGKIILGPIFMFFIISCKHTPPPEPHGPVPSQRQLDWQELETYAFVHFNMNTFTNMEWGFGDESPNSFNPTQLDCRQWARVCKEAGLKGIIITAKHHDGFCLWPSKYTEHSVKNSTWKNGKGDVIKELSEACQEYGLKMGVYLSPWDRNHPDYAKPEYLDYFRNQLTELLTNYGDIFEVWFDGANGGSGYYGGANETRKIDSKTYYEWENTISIIRELQPQAVVFGDGGPDIRWVGNEEGWANETNWSLLKKEEVYPGWPKYIQLRSGHSDGTHWIPAECDVSIRPGWYYHPYEDHKVKSVSTLVEIYYNSVGRNGSLLLNFPVDNRGLIHENDVERLNAFTKIIRQDLSIDLARGKDVSSTQIRGGDSNFRGANVNDGDKDTYWATDNDVTEASLTLDLGETMTFNRVLIQEYIPLGQRIEEFNLEALVDGNWELITSQTTIGYKRILRFDPVTASQIRLNITRSKACPVISNWEIYNAPILIVEPKIKRNKQAQVTIEIPDPQIEICYTLDGTDPGPGSTKNQQPFTLTKAARVKAISIDPINNLTSSISSQIFDVSKEKWKVFGASAGDLSKAGKIIDDDPETWWETGNQHKLPQEVTVDLGEILLISGFTYLPIQERWIKGVITNFELYTSPDGKDWSLMATGEFDNIVNNPIMQSVYFDQTIQAGFIKLKALATAYGAMSTPGDANQTVAIAEVGVISKPRDD